MSSKLYTEQFKVEAVKQVVERGYPALQVAGRLGVTTHSLYAWVDKEFLPYNANSTPHPAVGADCQSGNSEKLSGAWPLAARPGLPAVGVLSRTSGAVCNITDEAGRYPGKIRGERLVPGPHFPMREHMPSLGLTATG